MMHKMEKNERAMLLRDQKLKAQAARQSYLNQRREKALEYKRSFKDVYQTEIQDFEQEAKSLEEQEAELMRKLE